VLPLEFDSEGILDRSDAHFENFRYPAGVPKCIEEIYGWESAQAIMRGEGMAHSARIHLRDRAKSGDTAATIALIAQFRETNWLKRLENQRDRETAYALAKELDNEILQFDLQGSLHEEEDTLRTHAENGNVEAASILAHSFDDIGPLTVLAEEGNLAALGWMVELSDSGSSAQRMWLCSFAEHGGATEPYQESRRLQTLRVRSLRKYRGSSSS